MTQTFVIFPKLPSMNDLISWRMSSAPGKGGKRWNRYSDEKRKWQADIQMQVHAQKIKPVAGAVTVGLEWVENAKRDPDNISAGGRKLILDALVAMGILKGDGHKHIAGFSESFTLDRDPQHHGVYVTLAEVRE